MQANASTCWDHETPRDVLCSDASSQSPGPSSPNSARKRCEPQRRSPSARRSNSQTSRNKYTNTEKTIERINSLTGELSTLAHKLRGKNDRAGAA
jgi:hypothetical protein